MWVVIRGGGARRVGAAGAAALQDAVGAGRHGRGRRARPAALLRGALRQARLSPPRRRAAHHTRCHARQRVASVLPAAQRSAAHRMHDTAHKGPCRC
jgi:hypothetical protein